MDIAQRLGRPHCDVDLTGDSLDACPAFSWFHF
jgi:hypothetical protein